MIETAEQLAEEIGVKRACGVLGVVRSRLYRIRQAKMTESVPPLMGMSRTLCKWGGHQIGIRSSKRMTNWLRIRAQL